MEKQIKAVPKLQNVLSTCNETLATKEEVMKKATPVSNKKGSGVTKLMKQVKSETTGGTAAAMTPVRTSQRQTKRPKMDDELIDFESSSRGSTTKKLKTSFGTNVGTSKGGVSLVSTVVLYCLISLLL